MMKKLAAIISGICAIGFAVALANTNDIETQATSDAGGNTAQSTTTTTTTTTKTCTDDNGVTYYRGHTGFDDCMTQAQNSHHQMGGTVDQRSTTNDTSPATSNTGTGNSGSNTPSTTN